MDRGPYMYTGEGSPAQVIQGLSHMRLAPLGLPEGLECSCWALSAPVRGLRQPSSCASVAIFPLAAHGTYQSCFLFSDGL